MACNFLLEEDAISNIVKSEEMVRIEKLLSDYQKENLQSRFIMAILRMD
jgi:hypothetical protein